MTKRGHAILCGGDRIHTVDELKRLVGAAAVAYVEPGEVVGIGSGSTSEAFIRSLCESGPAIGGAIASSERTASVLRECGIPVLDLNTVGAPRLYVDGADEIDGELRLIKGGGGALAREKILASASALFVCIADESKMVDRLGRFPLPVEVLPFSRELVQRNIRAMGGEPSLREGILTDNGNEILDVAGLDMGEPSRLEREIDGIPGVVANGIFARRRADVVLLGTHHGVRRVVTEELVGDGPIAH